MEVTRGTRAWEQTVREQQRPSTTLDEGLLRTISDIQVCRSLRVRAQLTDEPLDRRRRRGA